MGLNAYLPDAGWRGPGAPFGEPWGQGLGALASYVRDAQWQGPGRPFGLGATCQISDLACLQNAMGISPIVGPVIVNSPPSAPPPDFTLSAADLNALAGPAGPDATNSVSGFFQSLIDQANSGAMNLPTGQQAAAGVTAAATSPWVWAAYLGGGFLLMMILLDKGGRR